jgi:hypothetical protein
VAIAEHRTIEISLDEVARGDATPAEATVAIRKAFAAEPPLVDRVYDALRDVTWRMLTSRSFDDELQDWFEVFRHASALANNSSAVAEKIGGFADLLEQSARFAELQPLQEVLNRKHSKRLLGALASAGKALQRSAIKNLLELADSNLSRVTGALQGVGLLQRSSSGKEASFALTELGRQAAQQLGHAINENAGNDRVWWLEAPFPLAVWDAGGKSLGANPAFRELAVLNAPEAIPALSDWRRETSKIAREERRLSSDTWQLRAGESKWIQFVEQTTADGNHCILANDISHHMEAMQSLEDKLEKLRRELLDAKGKINAFKSATSQIKKEMVDAAARSNEHVRKWINIWKDPSAKKVVPQELHEVERNLGAIQLAMRNVMEPVDIVEHEQAEIDWLDPKQMVEELVDTANVFVGTSITCKVHNVHKVRAAALPLRTALAHMIINGSMHGAQGADAKLKGSNLVATLRVDQYPDDPVTEFGLRYCKLIAESNGGALEVISGPSGRKSVSIVLSFPVEPKISGARRYRPFVHR